MMAFGFCSNARASSAGSYAKSGARSGTKIGSAPDRMASAA